MKIYQVFYKQENCSYVKYTMAENIHEVISRFTRPLKEGREITEVNLLCETDKHGDSIYLKEGFYE